MSTTPDDCTMRHELDAEERFPHDLTECFLCKGMTRMDHSATLVMGAREERFHETCSALVFHLARVLGCEASRVVYEQAEAFRMLGQRVRDLARCLYCDGTGRITDHGDGDECDKCDSIGLFPSEPDFAIALIDREHASWYLVLVDSLGDPIHEAPEL